VLYRHLAGYAGRYVGVDIIRFDGYPDHPGVVEFHRANLDSGRAELPDNLADVVCSLETIEHVENPRAFLRELVRLAKPGGAVIVTTPNQLSLLSKLCLLLKNEFVHFQERPGLYPAHLSALLEIDLVRMARENGLAEVETAFTGEGRVPGTSHHWPRWLGARGGWRGRAFSDNVLLFGRKPRS
jgi:SAM-dependent methyltransferase